MKKVTSLSVSKTMRELTLVELEQVVGGLHLPPFPWQKRKRVIPPPFNLPKRYV